MRMNGPLFAVLIIAMLISGLSLMFGLAFFATGITLPGVVLMGAIVAFDLFFSIALLGMAHYLDNKNWMPELKDFKNARRWGLPMLDLVDMGSGYGRFLIGEKDEEGDIVFKTPEGWGMHVDPTMISGDAEPTRYPMGLDIFHYSTVDCLPISPKNVVAINTVFRIRDAEFKKLQFLEDPELMALLNTPQNYLPDDCQIYMQKYDPEGLTTNLLVEYMIKFKDRLSKELLGEGWTCYAHAFQRIPHAYLSQDLEQLDTLNRKKYERDFWNKFDLWNKVMMGTIVIGITAVAIYIISLAANMRG